MTFLNMIRFSSISSFCYASSDIDKLKMFTLISSKIIGQDTFVKDLSFLLLKESYIFGKKVWQVFLLEKA